MTQATLKSGQTITFNGMEVVLLEDSLVLVNDEDFDRLTDPSEPAS